MDLLCLASPSSHHLCLTTPNLPSLVQLVKEYLTFWQAVRLTTIDTFNSVEEMSSIMLARLLDCTMQLLKLYVSIQISASTGITGMLPVQAAVKNFAAAGILRRRLELSYSCWRISRGNWSREAQYKGCNRAWVSRIGKDQEGGRFSRVADSRTKLPLKSFFPNWTEGVGQRSSCR